jgi:cytochrome c
MSAHKTVRMHGLKLGLALVVILGSLPALAQTASVARGKALYESRCIACHSVDTNRVGPMHRGVLGRRAGSVSGFAYSDALRGSTMVWHRETLQAWLKDPEALIPGQQMGYQVEGLQDRLDLVAYLSTL